MSYSNTKPIYLFVTDLQNISFALFTFKSNLDEKNSNCYLTHNFVFHNKMAVMKVLWPKWIKCLINWMILFILERLSIYYIYSLSAFSHVPVVRQPAPDNRFRNLNFYRSVWNKLMTKASQNIIKCALF